VNDDNSGTLTKIVSKEEIDMDQATGTDIDIKTIKEKINTKIGIYSIIYNNLLNPILYKK
tara:strand:+ start:926 stop:1105 length:180 start_codon:yes stop_codon:yes gene_type:complete